MTAIRILCLGVAAATLLSGAASAVVRNPGSEHPAHPNGNGNGNGNANGNRPDRHPIQRHGLPSPFSCMVESTPKSLYFTLTNTSSRITGAGNSHITICNLNQFPGPRPPPNSGCTDIGAFWVRASLNPGETYTIRNPQPYQSATTPTCSAAAPQ